MNPYHDPKSGRFTTSGARSGAGTTPKADAAKKALVKRHSKLAATEGKLYRQTTSPTSRKIVSNFQLQRQTTEKSYGMAQAKSIAKGRAKAKARTLKSAQAGTGPRVKGTNRVSGSTARNLSAKAPKNTGGSKLRSGATNKARSKSVTVVNSALANAKSSDYGKKLTAAQRSEIKRDIRMKGMTIPGKRTLAQKTYEHLLLQEGYRG